MKDAGASSGSPDAQYLGERPRISFVGYASFDSYVIACTTITRGSTSHIPIYTGQSPAIADLEVVAARLAKLTETQSASASTLVLSATGSPAAICAYLLASGIGARLLLLDDPTQYRTAERQKVCVVALSEAISDGMLLESLRHMTQPCRERRAWSDDSNGYCFVTAGDLAGLSRYVARLLAATWETPDAKSFHMVASDSGHTEYHALSLGEHRRAHFEELAPEAVGNTVAGAGGVLALLGHGGDACAYAGGVTVLCGRRPHVLAPGRGTLACLDEGVGCPRAPSPVPMATLRAQHVLQGSCSSARFGDSVLTPAFNLLLSFVDGTGLSYIGMAMGGSGRVESCLLYLAAMADGKSFGGTLTLMNCFLELAGLDQGVYVGLGLPDLRACPQRAAGDFEEPESIGANGEFSCDFGDRFFGTLIVSDPILIDWSASNRLALDLESPTGPTEARWFCRLEELGEGDGLHLRIFVFSFPKPLGHIRFKAFDRLERVQGLQDRLRSIQRWIDYHRLIAGAESEGVATGLVAYNKYRDWLPSIIEPLRCNGLAHRMAESFADSMDSTRVLLRDLLVAELGERLSESFWLANSLLRDQYYLSSDQSRCPACAGKSFRRHFRSHLSDENRTINVCMRCGIMEDFRVASEIVEVRVSCPETAERGGSLSVVVEVHGTPHLRECLAVAGVSGPYAPKLETQTFQADVLDCTACVLFVFEIPHTMPLHELRWKCVVADDTDIAFVSRNFFVIEAGSPLGISGETGA